MGRYTNKSQMKHRPTSKSVVLQSVLSLELSSHGREARLRAGLEVRKGDRGLVDLINSSRSHPACECLFNNHSKHCSLELVFSYARTHATLPTSSPSTILSSEATELGSSSAFGIQPGIFLLPALFFPPFFLLSPQKSCSSFSSQVFLIGPPQTPLQTPFLSPPRSSPIHPVRFLHIPYQGHCLTLSAWLQ